MNILQKINWKVRKINITISLLNIFINTNWEGWGFNLLTIQKNLNDYSLLKLCWQFPNGADKQLKFEGDFLFLRTYLLKLREDLDDNKLWSTNGLSNLDTFKLTILNMKIYKLDSKGKVRVLEVTTNEGNLIQTSGLLDGKKVEHKKLCKPKNIGKINETTEVTQSEFEAEALIVKKLREGYFKTIEEA